MRLNTYMDAIEHSNGCETDVQPTETVAKSRMTAIDLQEAWYRKRSLLIKSVSIDTPATAAKNNEKRSVWRDMRDTVKPLKSLRLLSSARAVPTAVAALTAVLVLAAFLVTPPAERVSAQDDGTATTAG